MNTLQMIQKWYLSQCDGDWEHQQGVKINTIDNPGWRVSIDIAETELESKFFPVVDTERREDDWVYCRVVDGVFDGAGGPLNLEELLQIFLRWAKVDNGE